VVEQDRGILGIRLGSNSKFQCYTFCISHPPCAATALLPLHHLLRDKISAHPEIAVIDMHTAIRTIALELDKTTGAVGRIIGCSLTLCRDDETCRLSEHHACQSDRKHRRLCILHVRFTCLRILLTFHFHKSTIIHYNHMLSVLPALESLVCYCSIQHIVEGSTHLEDGVIF
jgi:hypothetical protein